MDNIPTEKYPEHSAVSKKVDVDLLEDAKGLEKKLSFIWVSGGSAGSVGSGLQFVCGVQNVVLYMVYFMP